jgi:glucose-6-phosphate 1-dehydrogenase
MEQRLQVVAFLAMEAPTGLYCDAIRHEQVKAFRTISPLDTKHLVRGQFNGYKKGKGSYLIPGWRRLPPYAWKFIHGGGQLSHS